jgi:hypothetical protein
VSVLQALAGTGKTRVLATLARVYEAGGYRVVGVAPTGRGARELADTAHISAFTIQRLVADLQESGFAARTVVLFDEAGTAPTRPSAALFTAAERDGVKIVAVGDSGQLPSVAAGGWFAALTQTLRGPELRQVMRQHDPSERDALAQLHDGDPDPYLELKQERGDLQVHDEEADALTATLAEWDQARRKHGISQAMMIARDNATRTVLNEHARKLLAQVGQLAGPGAEIADQEFRIGDRVIARRNDRYRDIDNGTLATITQIHHHTGTLGLTTDAGHERVLDASYAAEHLEHAYALTGHGAQGATVASAIVIGRPPNSRANGPTPPSPAPALRRVSTSSPSRRLLNATVSNTHHPNPNLPAPKRSTPSAVRCDGQRPSRSRSSRTRPPSYSPTTGPRMHGSGSPSCPRPAPSARPITTSATSQRLPNPIGARKHATAITAATTATPTNASPPARENSPSPAGSSCRRAGSV